jgi:predicted RNA-binding protein with PUA-like domain
MAKRYWLMKSEPDVYGIDDLEEEGSAHWDGVRNYQARNFMRDEMKVGDKVLFYHSNAKPPGVAGVAEVVKEAYPDHTAFDKKSNYYDAKSKKDDPRWFMVDVGFVEKFADVVPLNLLKETAGLEEMMVIRRGMRLSIQPVTKKEFDIVVKIGRKL